MLCKKLDQVAFVDAYESAKCVDTLEMGGNTILTMQVADGTKFVLVQTFGGQYARID